MAYVARLKKEYKERIIAALTEEFGYSNVMQVPKLEIWIKASFFTIPP